MGRRGAAESLPAEPCFAAAGLTSQVWGIGGEGATTTKISVSRGGTATRFQNLFESVFLFFFHGNVQNQRSVSLSLPPSLCCCLA